jgi:hypothetical protein
MESLRIREKNIIYTRLREINTFISRNKNSMNNTTFAQDKFFIQKLVEKNENFLIEIDTLNHRLLCLEKGLLDKELMDTLANNAENMENSKKKSELKINIKKEQNLKDKVIIDTFYKNNRNDNYNSERNMQKETDKFFKFSNSISDNIKRNLSDMPSNKGYIWKGIWCFGDKQPERNKPLIMFEKLRDGIMKIHEIDSTSRKIYEKKGKDKKILIHSESKVALK